MAERVARVYPEVETQGAKLPLLASRVSQLSFSETEKNNNLKLQSENLTIKVDQLKIDLKHYKKLKNRWNMVKNIFHYGKYPLAVILAAGDIALIFTGIGAVMTFA